MVFKVGDTVKIIQDDKREGRMVHMSGRYGTIKEILEYGIMLVDHIRDTKEENESGYANNYWTYLRSDCLEVCNPTPKFSIHDWDSIMEVIANEQI